MAKSSTVVSMTRKSPPVTSLTNEEAVALSIVAFNEDDAGRKQVGTAVQRMAAAIMGLCGNMSDMPPLAEVISPTSTDARVKVKNLAVLHFILGGKGVLMSPPSREEKKENRRLLEAYNVQRNHVALVNDGLDLVGILAKFNVTLVSFDRDTGIWTVPSKMLTKGDWKLDSDFDTVQLDGKGWYQHIPAHEKDGEKVDVQYGRAFASFRQLRSAHKLPRETTNSNRANSGQGASASKDVDGKLSSLLDAATRKLRPAMQSPFTYKKQSEMNEIDQAAINRFIATVEAMRKQPGFMDAVSKPAASAA